jgi:hypothetical protein
MTALAVHETADHVSQRGQTLVDADGFFKTVAHCPGLRLSFTPGQVDEVQFALSDVLGTV